MGAETEFAVSGLRDGALMDPDDVYELLADGVRTQRAWLPDHHGYRGMYLQHGGRLYLDYGSHPEHATPECHVPRQVALYDKVGEHLLALGRDAAQMKDKNLQIRIIKNNLDPVEPDENTYGTHESYTLWGDSHAACPQMLPHLVSRILYAGSGGLSGAEDGIGFELSQRARHIEVPESDDTTSCRPIFGTRIRKVTDGGLTWVRVHLVSKDSQRSPFGTYLTFATTGLLIEMLNRGHKVGQGLTLVDPVRAIKKISRDPYARVRVPLADGRHLTAIEIQAVYLEQSEKAVQSGGMPDWAAEAVALWRQTLAELERDPLQLADRLDPYCKLLIVEHELLRAGYDWSDLRGALSRLNDLRSYYGERLSRAVLTDSDVELTPEEREHFPQARDTANVAVPGMLDKLLFATRLQALEIQYHEVGGLYDRLRDAGRMKDVILTQAEVEEASRTPPPGGRAAIRGEWIRRHGRQTDWRADWQFVWHGKTGAIVDLRDPFDGQEKPRRLLMPENTQPYNVDVLELLQTAAG